MGNIYVTDVSASVWVSASAGTGKTKNLIDRILALLVNGVQPSKILCLTYTKNATNEMLYRLNQKITYWSVADDVCVQNELVSIGINKNLYKTAKTLAQISRTERWVRIQTIHSFSQEIINMFPVEANIMPNNDIVDDTSNLLEQAYIDTLKNEKLKDDFLFIFKYKDSLLDIIKENIQQIQKFFETYEWNDTTAIYDNFFEVQYKDDYEILNSLCTYEHKTLCNQLKEFFDKQSDVEALEMFPSFDILNVFLKADGTPRSRILPSSIIKKNNLSESLALLTNLACDMIEHRNRLLLSRLNTSFMKITHRMLQHYEAIKRTRNALDYNDIIDTAISIMKKYEHVRHAVDCMLDHVLIDEAQDTSATQWNAIELIVSDFFTHYKSHKTVFVVGDNKQSIYSFQGADFDLFASMHDYFKNAVTSCEQKWHDVILNMSYRSCRSVVDFVNKTFDLNESTARSEITGSVAVNKLYELHMCDDLVPLKRVAQDVVKFIKSTIDSRIFLPSRNRSAEPQDFMILAQRRSILQKFVTEELKKQNIPCLGYSKINIKCELIVEDIIALARFCVLKHDDLNLAIVLKGPIFNISEDQLFEICVHRKEKSIWKYITENNILDEHVRKLKSYISYSLSKPYDFFMKIAESGDLKLLLSRCGTIEIFNTFMDICFKYNGPQSLSSFLRWFEITNFSTNVNKPSDLNGVSMLTVHGAKGLQSPIVIILDAAFSNKKHNQLVSCGHNFVFLSHSECATERSNAFSDNIKKKELNESKRLMYVALTRAEDMLSIFAHTSLKNISDESWYALLNGPQQIGYLTSITQSTGRNIINLVDYPRFVSLPTEHIEDEIVNNAEKYGNFVHFLLEKLPKLDKSLWKQFCDEQKIDDQIKEKAYNEATNVLEKFQWMFDQQSYSEVEVSLNGKLKRIDKICVVEGEIYVIDFKTGNDRTRIKHYKKQLATYKSILENKMLDKKIRTFILWTHDAQLIEVNPCTKKNSDQLTLNVF